MPRKLSFDPPATTTATPVTVSVQPITTHNPVAVPVVPAYAGVPGKPLTMEEISNFGDRAQNQLATVTDRISASAKTSDMDEIGKLLNDTIMSAKGYDPSNLFKKGVFSFLRGKANQLQMRFDTVDQTVNRLVGEIDKRIDLFRRRIGDLQNLAEQNEAFYHALGQEIIAINQRADWMEANIPEVDPAQPMTATHRQQWITVITFARKRADDLQRAQLLAQQQQAQIAQMADNSGVLAMTFSDIKKTTIPAMKTTFSLYVLNMEQKAGAEFSNTTKDLNDDLIKKNAALLGQNTIAVNTALTRSNVSTEALQANHDSIIKALEDVERIRADMKTRLAQEAPRLEQLSNDLAKRLAHK